jgi:hypothetical protein
MTGDATIGRSARIDARADPAAARLTDAITENLKPAQLIRALEVADLIGDLIGRHHQQEQNDRDRSARQIEQGEKPLRAVAQHGM